MRTREVLVLCPAGFERIVRAALAEDLPGLQEVELSPGYVRCRASVAASTLAAMPYATNVFDVVASVQRSDQRRELGTIAAVLPGTQLAGLPRRGAFRLRLFDDGRFSTTGSPQAAHLTAALASWSGLRHEPRGGQYEFWVIRRRASGSTVLGIKLGPGRPQPPRGSLRPEIASALVRTVPLDRDATVLDPFAGSGAIGMAAIEAGAGRVWLNDHLPGSLGMIGRLPSAALRRVHQTHLDFRLLPDANGPAVTAVITDPPWGLFRQADEPIGAFYAELAVAMARMLAAGRPMIVLTGAPPAVEVSLAISGLFSVADSAAVLVNGKKARVISAKRTSAPAPDRDPRSDPRPVPARPRT